MYKLKIEECDEKANRLKTIEGGRGANVSSRSGNMVMTGVSLSVRVAESPDCTTVIADSLNTSATVSLAGMAKVVGHCEPTPEGVDIQASFTPTTSPYRCRCTEARDNPAIVCRPHFLFNFLSEARH